MKNEEITVMLAEDEPIILNNIAKKVEHTADDIHVIGKAQNGRDTLELMKENVPDILITDIEMPGMNGLDLIHEVRLLYPHIHIIVLSGYSNFEYARTALKYGVDDYILKPVAQDDLTAVLNKTVQALLLERHQTERSILAKTLQGSQVDCASPSSFRNGRFLLILITLGNLPSAYGSTQPAQQVVKLWETIDFNAFFASQSYFDHTWIIDEVYPLQKFIILHTKEEEIRYPLVAMQLFYFIQDAGIPIPYHVMIGSRCIDYQQIWEAARNMRSFLPQYIRLFTSSYLLYPDEASPCPTLDLKLKREHSDCLYRLQNGSSFIPYVLNSLRDYQEKNYAQNVLEDFLFDVFHAIPVMFKLEENSCQECMHLVLSSIYRMKKMEELCDSLQHVISKLLENSKESYGSHNLYEKMKQYVEHNYNQKISLEDLSARYGYTSSYINRLFKKECGMSPLQYQTSLRIQQAKDLLLKDMDIKDIAAAIGYEDARYFSRVFKNEAGMTPTEWNRAHGR